MMAILAFVVDAALRGLVVAAAIGAVLALSPRRSATLRLRAWTLVLYALLAMPVVALMAPVWRAAVPPVPVFPVFNDAQAVQTVLLAAADAPTAVIANPVRPSSTAWPVLLMTIYVMGVAWLSFQAVLAWRFVRRLHRRARPIDDAAVLDRLARHSVAAGLRSTPGLKEGADLFSPVTMFVRRPLVILPDDWRSWPSEHLDGVLAHELSHIARQDALTQRLALVYRAIFWFSPLSWWLKRQLGRLGELASDESALAAGVEPLTYADALLACFVRAQDQTRRTSWHLAMARRDDADAAKRIERILSWKGGPTMTRTRLTLAGVSVLVAPLTVLAASVHFAPATLPAIAVPAANIGVVMPLPPAMMPAAPVIVSRTTAPQLPPAVQTPAPKPTPEPQKSEEDLEFLKGSYELNTPGLVMPVAVNTPKPRYTPDGMRQKLQGTVTVDMIVATDGTVSKARIAVSLDKSSGLDDAALDAAKQWTFTPGTLHGESVPVHVGISLVFRLH